MGEEMLAIYTLITCTLAMFFGISIVRSIMNPDVVRYAYEKLKELSIQAEKIKRTADESKASKKLRKIALEVKYYKRIITRATIIRTIVFFLAFVLASMLVLSKAPVVATPNIFPLSLISVKVGKVHYIQSVWYMFLIFMLLIPVANRLTGVRR